VAVAAIVGGLTLFSAPPAFSAPAGSAQAPVGGTIPDGSYAGPIEMTSGMHPGRMVLDRIDVTRTEVTAHLRLINTLPKKLLMTCPEKAADDETRILRVAGEDLRPSASYCTQNPGAKRAINVGAALPVTATFPAKSWVDGTFGLFWYGYAAGAMQLRAGEIVAVAPPEGSRLGDIRSPWAKFRDQVGEVGLLLGLVVLIAFLVWLRWWYVRADGRTDIRAPETRPQPPREESWYPPRPPAAAPERPSVSPTPDNVIGLAPRRGRRRMPDRRH
jgi:hypothetical protein